MTRTIKGDRPKIGVDLHVLEGIHQGSRTHCFELFSRALQRLPEMDFRFFVDTERWQASYSDMFTAANAEVVQMPHANSIARLVRHLPKLARRHKIDLLHTQYICPPWVSAANAVTIHDILFEDYPQYFSIFLRYRSKLFFRLSAKRAQIVCTVSDYSKQQLIEKYGVYHESIVTIKNGVNLDRFFPGSEGVQELAAFGFTPGNYLLTVGRLEPRKNHIGLLKAFASLPRGRPRLLVVGQRDFGYESVFQLRDSLGLQEEVIFLETADDDLLAILYRNCRAFVYPTFAEGFGMPVLEAMASGAPVVASDTTAIPEVTGDAAILVDPHSSVSIARGMSQVLSQPDLAERLGRRGLERAKGFTWESSTDLLVEAYRSYFETA